MPTERKMDLISKLQDLGEDVPTAWNTQQIKARLAPEGRTTCSPEEPTDRAQSCSSEEGNSHRLCPGLGDPGASQRHHQCALCQVRREDHGGDAADGQRPGELRQALRQEVQGDPGGMSLLCRVDPNHSRREPRVVVAPETTGTVVEDHHGGTAHHTVQEDREGSPSVGISSPPCQGESKRIIDRPVRRVLPEDPNRRFRLRTESLEDRTGPAPLREQHDGSANVAQQVPQGDLSDLDDFEDNSEWEDCPEHQCFQAHRKIGQNWLESRNPYGKSWEELISLDRLFLLEVACSERSILSEEVLSRHDQTLLCDALTGMDLI